MKIEIVNLTKSPITIVNDKLSFTVQPSGTVARASAKNKKTFSPLCDLIPLVEEMYVEYKNLPSPRKNTVFIVSKETGRHIHNRPDVFYPVYAAQPSKTVNGKQYKQKMIGFSAFKPCL